MKSEETRTYIVDVNCVALDTAIEKANRLVELLTQATNLIDSLSTGRQLES